MCMCSIYKENYPSMNQSGLNEEYKSPCYGLRSDCKLGSGIYCSCCLSCLGLRPSKIIGIVKPIINISFSSPQYFWYSNQKYCEISGGY